MYLLANFSLGFYVSCIVWWVGRMVQESRCTEGKRQITVKTCQMLNSSHLQLKLWTKSLILSHQTLICKARGIWPRTDDYRYRSFQLWSCLHTRVLCQQGLLIQCLVRRRDKRDKTRTIHALNNPPLFNTIWSGHESVFSQHVYQPILG